MRGAAIALCASAVLVAGSQETGSGPRAEIQLRPADIQWTDGPPSLPHGAKFSVLSGDPAKSGPFVMRLKFPADYKVMPHSHSVEEHVTVISGTLFISRGDAFDPQKGKELPQGSYAMMPSKSNHFAYCKQETVLQLHSNGPWDILYANPGDDPRKK